MVEGEQQKEVAKNSKLSWVFQGVSLFGAGQFLAFLPAVYPPIRPFFAALWFGVAVAVFAWGLPDFMKVQHSYRHWHPLVRVVLGFAKSWIVLAIIAIPFATGLIAAFGGSQ